MSIRPLGHRVLIAPDEPETTTASGLALPQDRDHIPTSGVVVAKGPGGVLMRFKSRQRALTDAVGVIESAIRQWGAIAPLALVRDEVAGLLGTPDIESEIAVGDRVAFASESALRIVEDGVAYLVLNEVDVVVLVHEEVAA